MKGGLKYWEKAVPIKPPDNLCASSFTQKAFVPSYEKPPSKPPDMMYMVTMEYRRMWFDERSEWEKQVYPACPKSTVPKVQVKKRDKGKAKDSKDTPKKKKRFGSIVSKTDTGRSSTGSNDNASTTASELVPQCPKCGKFHPENSPCPDLESTDEEFKKQK